MTASENNKVFFFYLHLEEISLNLVESDLYLTLQFKINAFWQSSNCRPPQRRTLIKGKSNRFNKVLLTEFSWFKRDILGHL